MKVIRTFTSAPNPFLPNAPPTLCFCYSWQCQVDNTLMMILRKIAHLRFLANCEISFCNSCQALAQKVPQFSDRLQWMEVATKIHLASLALPASPVSPIIIMHDFWILGAQGWEPKVNKKSIIVKESVISFLPRKFPLHFVTRPHNKTKQSCP